MKNDIKIILSFTGEYSFLSNFYEYPIYYDGIIYRNSEAAFQSAKCMNKDGRLGFSDLNPSEAKRLGRRVKLRPDWEDVKDQIMYDIVKAKFSAPELAKMLLDTGSAGLYEGNTWGDMYWGIDSTTLRGRNKLGEILMRVRDEIVKGIIPVNLQND